MRARQAIATTYKYLNYFVNVIAAIIFSPYLVLRSDLHFGTDGSTVIQTAILRDLEWAVKSSKDSGSVCHLHQGQSMSRYQVLRHTQHTQDMGAGR